MTISSRSILVCFLWLPFLAAAQPVQTGTTAQDHAKACTATSGDDLPDLVKCLVAGATDPEEQLWRMIYWITENIAYNVDRLPGEITAGQHDILAAKKGICNDYAAMFAAMCSLAKLDCYVVEGYSKGWGVRPEREFVKPDHAWNVVCLPDTMYLMDLTWASGTVTDNLGFEKDFNPEMVFADPETFSLSHLPADPRWQLRAAPIPLHRFEQYNTYAELTVGLQPSINHRDSIAAYRSSDEHDRMAMAGQSAYQFNPTHENLRRWLTKTLYHCNLIWQDDPQPADYQRTIRYSQLVHRKAQETPGFSQRKYFMEQALRSIKYAKYMLDTN